MLAFWPTALSAFLPYKAFALLALVTVAGTGAMLDSPRAVPRLLMGAWLALGSVLLLSAVGGYDAIRSVKGGYPRYESLPVLLAATALVWLVPALLDKKGVARASEVMFAGMSLVGLYAILQGLNVDPLHMTVGGRAWSTVGNPILLGTVAATMAPYAIAISMTGRGTPWMRRLAPAAAALAVSAAFFSQSRSAWAGLVAGLIVVAALTWRIMDRRRAIAVGGVIVVALAAVLVVPWSRSMVIGRFSSGLDVSAKSRELKWRVGLGMLASRPVLGWGWDTVAEVYPSRVPKDWTKQDPERVITDRLHDEPLDIAVASGLLGLLAVAAVALLGIGTMLPALRAGPTSRTLAAGLAGNVVAYGVASLTGFPSVSTWPLVWMSLGLAAAIGLAAGAPSGRLKRLTGPDLRIIAVALAAITLVGTIWSVQDIAADQSLFSAMMTPGQNQALVFGRAAARFPDDPHVQLGAAEGMLALGRAANDLNILEEARRMAGKAMSLRPNDPAYRTLFADTLLAMAIRGRPELLDPARGAYFRALQLAPYDPSLLGNAGLAEFARQVSDGYFSAETLWKRAWALDPTNVDIALNMALASERLGNLTEARRWASIAEKIDPTAPDLAAIKKRLAKKR
jgi:O-antigen ligase/Flp pilus assembly protein TadD